MRMELLSFTLAGPRQDRSVLSRRIVISRHGDRGMMQNNTLCNFLFVPSFARKAVLWFYVPLQRFDRSPLTLFSLVTRTSPASARVTRLSASPAVPASKFPQSKSRSRSGWSCFIDVANNAALSMTTVASVFLGQLRMTAGATPGVVRFFQYAL